MYLDGKILWQIDGQLPSFPMFFPLTVCPIWYFYMHNVTDAFQYTHSQNH